MTRGVCVSGTGWGVCGTGGVNLAGNSGASVPATLGRTNPNGPPGVAVSARGGMVVGCTWFGFWRLPQGGQESSDGSWFEEPGRGLRLVSRSERTRPARLPGGQRLRGPAPEQGYSRAPSPCPRTAEKARNKAILSLPSQSARILLLSSRILSKGPHELLTAGRCPRFQRISGEFLKGHRRSPSAARSS